MKYPASGNLWRTQTYYGWTTAKNGGLLNEIRVGTTDGGSERFYRQYTYNSFGDVATLKEGSTTYPFVYDNLGRLTSGYSKNYTYWPTNRMNTFEGQSYGYASFPYHAVNTVGGVDRYDYDANGNMTIRGKGLSTQQALTWNAENRLASLTATGISESYAYDADGNRIKKVSGSVTTRTFFPLYEEEGSTAIKHYSFNGQRIATRKGGTLRYVHADHLGSSSVETSSTGSQSASRAYYAYGSTRSSSGTLQTDRTFTGQKADGTGLHYYNARYYDPALGTFLSPDTLVPDAGRVIDYNRFLYVRGNPLKYSDPSGHCALLDDGSRSSDDAECWEMADELYNGWGGDEDYWKELFGVNDRDIWMEIYGNNPGTNAAYFQGHLDNYWRDFYRGTGIYHEKYNPAPVMNPMPPQRELWSPGSQLITTVGRDVYACTHSVTDCGNALDDMSTTLSGVAMGCLVAGFVPCAGVASTAGNFVDVAGVVLTAHNTLKNGDSYFDLIVAIGGTTASMAYGEIGEGSVGFGISLLQWIYGHQESQR